jgi:DNA invertase Pin-like site-specific DNA recombinase
MRKKANSGGRRGELHQRAVYTDHEIDLVREARKSGMTWTAIALKYEMSRRHVRNICAGKVRL